VSALALDTGALIAVERGDRRVVHLVEEARSRGIELRVVAGVLAQAWRGGPQQARLARLLRAAEVDVPALDATTARAVGELCGRSGQADVVDVHVVLDARLARAHVVTSDPDDLRRVDPSVTLIEI
jgi:hypothetical protein